MACGSHFQITLHEKRKLVGGLVINSTNANVVRITPMSEKKRRSITRNLPELAVVHNL